MLWDAGLLARGVKLPLREELPGNADMLVMTSIEGALAACLVNLPHDAAEALAGEAMLHMRPPQLGSRNRLKLDQGAKLPGRGSEAMLSS